VCAEHGLGDDGIEILSQSLAQLPALRDLNLSSKFVFVFLFANLLLI
jgi:hypothetical protein